MRPVTPFMTILTTSVGSLPMMNTLNEVIWAGQPGAGRPGCCGLGRALLADATVRV
jgi:hypothetical protein